MRSFELPWCSSVCLSVWDGRVSWSYVSADLSLWLDSPMFWAPWHQRCSPTLSRLSPVPSGRKVGMCKLRTISREQLKIEVKLLLSANRKSYVPRRLAQQRMTLSDLEWPFLASRAISVVAELPVFICQWHVQWCWRTYWKVRGWDLLKKASRSPGCSTLFYPTSASATPYRTSTLIIRRWSCVPPSNLTAKFSSRPTPAVQVSR